MGVSKTATPSFMRYWVYMSFQTSPAGKVPVKAIDTKRAVSMAWETVVEPMLRSHRCRLLVIRRKR